MQFFRPTANDLRLAEYMRLVVEKSRALLSQPIPDTFLGRKMQEPFPPEDEEHMARWMASEELQPPK